MKLSAELRNLPVVSITEGEEIGTVKDFIVDPSAKAIVAMIVEDSSWYEGAKVLMFSQVHSIGNSAITTESAASVVELSSMPELTDLLKRHIQIYDSKVLTRGGRSIGRVNEYSIDQHTGNILGLELREKDAGLSDPDKNVIPTSSIVTIGKNVTIVEDDVEQQMTSGHSGIDGGSAPAPRTAAPPPPRPAAPPAPKAAPKPVAVEPDFAEATAIADRVEESIVAAHEDEKDLEDLDFDSVLDSIQEDLPSADKDEEEEDDFGDLDDGADEFSISEPAEELSAAEPAADLDAGGGEKENLAEIFERRQIKYMINKKVSKDIDADNGSTIIGKGDVITEAVIQKAKAAGKFLELSMNIEVED